MACQCIWRIVAGADIVEEEAMDVATIKINADMITAAMISTDMTATTINNAAEAVAASSLAVVEFSVRSAEKKDISICNAGSASRRIIMVPIGQLVQQLAVKLSGSLILEPQIMSQASWKNFM